MRYAFAAVIFTACTDVASITPDVCGNYVLETGEDCDRPGGACTSSCRISCDPTMRTDVCASADAIDGSCCPTGLTCGADKVCHAATGTVAAAPITSPFDGLGFALADVNGDLIDDFFGVAVNFTELRYGAPGTPFATSVSSPSPTVALTSTSQGAQVGFGDLDGDHRLDIVIPTQSGLFAFTTDDGGLDPVQFPATVTQGVVHERVAFVGAALLNLFQLFVTYDYVPNHGPTDTNYQLTLSTAPTAATQTFTVVDNATSLCGVTTISNVDFAVRGRALHPFVDGNIIRVPIVLGTASVEICVATANPTSAGQNTWYAVPKALWGTGYRTVTGDGETFFANLYGAAGTCPDLVAPAVDTTPAANDYTIILKGLPGTTGCTVDLTPVNAVFLRGRPLAAITLQPALQASEPGLITTIGVYSGFAVGTPAVATQATRRWTYAVVADLDGDGKQDFAALGPAEDVEVFRQLPWIRGIGTIQWNDYTIPTSNPVDIVALGNFDGDKAGDVAIGTSDLASSTPVEDLSIAWGSVDGTFSVADVGEFAEAHNMCSLNLVDTSLPPGVDHNDDLLITRGGGDGTNPNNPALVIAEYGATSRALIAPYVFTSAFGAATQQHAVGVVAQIGNFGANFANGVAAIFAPPASANGTTTNTALLALTQQSYGGFTAGAPSLSASCGAGTSSSDQPFCTSKGRYTTMTRSTGDLFLGLRADKDGGALSECAVYFVANGGPPALATMSCAGLAPQAAASTDPIVQGAYMNLVDVGIPKILDNDGTTEHIALLQRGTNAQQAHRWDLTVSASGQPQLANPVDFSNELATSGAVPMGSTVNCMDVAPAELGTRIVGGKTYGADKELVVACGVSTGGSPHDTQLWTRYSAPDGSAPHYTLLYDSHANNTVTLRAGDVDGDGLDDILWTDGTNGRQTLHVLLQCDAHQTDCQGGL